MNDTRRRYGTRVIVIGSLDGPDEVVFHAPTAFEPARDIGLNRAGEVTRGRVARVRCGRVVCRTSWRELNGVTVAGSYSSSDRRTSVHIEHAVKFARPCLQCWRVQQLELVARQVA